MEVFLQASSCKERGNALHSEGKFEEAIDQYQKGISIIAKEKEKFHELFISFHNNISSCYLKLKNHEETFRYSKIVVDEDPKNWKGYMRLLRSLTLSGEYRKFFSFYEVFMKNCPQKAGIEEVQNTLHESRLKYLQKLNIHVSNDQKFVDILPVENKGTIIGMTVGFMANNVYILECGKECGIIDCPAPLFSMLKDYIKEKERVHLILTHGHLDHIFDIQEFLPLENVTVYCHKLDKFWLDLGEEDTIGYMSKFLPIPGMDIRTIMQSPWLLQMAGIPKAIEFKNIKPDIWFGETNETEKVVIGRFEIEVIHTPGHSSGCVCLWLREEKVCFTGDTLFCGSVGRYDLQGSDLQTLCRSIQQVLYKQLSDDTIVYPGHPTEKTKSTIGEEKIKNVLKGIQ